MEDAFIEEFNDLTEKDLISGCVVADSQGLSVAASPNIQSVPAGLVSAVAQQAAKIDPKASEKENPVINIENDTRQCLIHSVKDVTVAIFKNVSGLS